MINRGSNSSPVPKIGLPCVAADFRPISLLCTASKVFERIVYLQIREYVDRNKLMDVYQSGFRRGHSTQTALLRVMDDVRAAVNVGHVTLLVTVDLPKAFNMVDCDVLIDRLGVLGWSNMACDWTRSYLTGRTQRVVGDDGTVSASLGRTSGVPQGNLPGPLLYTLYANGSPRSLVHCRPTLISRPPALRTSRYRWWTD
uniref:Reverse transcriptase domain-containing protein n=1 Tax=Trichogramma kaykai TaxID=54128 RepID=A0ABD2WEV9_9HYME